MVEEKFTEYSGVEQTQKDKSPTQENGQYSD